MLALLAAHPALPPTSRATLFASDPHPKTTPFENVQYLKDISGMAYVEDGTFVAVHDMKADEEASWPRVSLIRIPKELKTGLQWAPLFNAQINWPKDRKLMEGDAVIQDYATEAGPNDLESAALIPGTSPPLFLLCESGNSGKNDAYDASGEKTGIADRIYLAGVHYDKDTAEEAGGSVQIKEYTTFSTFADISNVEATAVAATKAGHLFLYAERNTATIRWFKMTLNPLVIHKEGGGSASFTLPKSMELLAKRPVVGLDVDEKTGVIYAVASHDPEGEIDEDKFSEDNGPYSSATYTIGTVHPDGTVAILPGPDSITHQDGFKVETVARAQSIPKSFKTEKPATYIGTDDENYGGTLRKLTL